jgi:hypothetical protein
LLQVQSDYLKVENKWPLNEYYADESFEGVGLRFSEVGTRQSVLAFEEDWLKPGPEQCDLFTLPRTDWAQCDISHPNNTQTGTPIEETILAQDSSRRILLMLTIYSLSGIILTSGIIINQLLNRWYVEY